MEIKAIENRENIRRNGNEISIFTVRFDDGSAIRNSADRPDFWERIDGGVVTREQMLAVKKSLAYVFGHYGKNGEIKTQDDY